MSLLNYLFRRKQHHSSASQAKERLQIIVSHQRGLRQGLDYLPLLQNELMQVIKKYVQVDLDQVKVEVEHEENCAILELNITLPDMNPNKEAS